MFACMYLHITCVLVFVRVRVCVCMYRLGVHTNWRSMRILFPTSVYALCVCVCVTSLFTTGTVQCTYELNKLVSFDFTSDTRVCCFGLYLELLYELARTRLFAPLILSPDTVYTRMEQLPGILSRFRTEDTEMYGLFWAKSL